MGNKMMQKQKWLKRGFIALYAIIAWLLASQIHIPSFDNITGNPRISIIVVGALIFAMAIVLYIPSRYSITSNCSWSGYHIHDKNILITRGPYRYIRHPQHTAYFTAGIATGLILTNSAILVFMLLLAPVLYLKAKIEEQYLTEIFPEYKEYKEKTDMFF